MGGREDDVEGLSLSCGALGGQKPVQRSQGGGADLRLAGTAFRHDEGDAPPVQLALDRLGHRQLGVVEGVSGILPDAAVDGQHLLRQRLRGRIEQGLKLVSDAVRNGDAKGVEVPGDVLHTSKAVWLTGVRAGYGDLT